MEHRTPASPVSIGHVVGWSFTALMNAMRFSDFTPGGIPVANFSLAVKETYKNGSGEKKTSTLWIRCVA